MNRAHASISKPFLVGPNSVGIWLIVGLQILDLFTTLIALSTGKAVEQNQLIHWLGSAFGIGLTGAICLAKLFVAFVFLAAARFMRSDYDRRLLLGACIFYGVVCLMNIRLIVAIML